MKTFVIKSLYENRCFEIIVIILKSLLINLNVIENTRTIL